MPDPAVLVVGMHRSGTSAVAGALHAMGLAVASGEDLLSENRWNERGFFESRQLLLLNNQLLVALGGTWSAPPRLTPGWERDTSLDRLRASARRVFGRAFPRRPFVWKDPRNCITLPFWRGVVADPVAAVFVYRHPLEVGRSLEARGGAGLTYGVALWDRYVRAASAHLAGLPTLAADFDRILDAPDTWTRRLAEFLESAGFVPETKARTDATASLDAALRHQRAPVVAPAGPWNPQLEMFEALRHRDGIHPTWPALDLGPEPDWVEEILALRRDGDRYRRLEELLRTSRSFRIGRILWHRRHPPVTGGLIPEL